MLRPCAAFLWRRITPSARLAMPRSMRGRGTFRRVPRPLLRMGGACCARAALAAHLIDHRGSLPERALDPDVEYFRGELRLWLATNWSDADRARQRAKPRQTRPR